MSVIPYLLGGGLLLLVASGASKDPKQGRDPLQRKPQDPNHQQPKPSKRDKLREFVKRKDDAKAPVVPKDPAVPFVLELIRQALPSKVWSEETRVHMQAIEGALSNDPTTKVEKFAAPVKDTAAFASLVSIPESERTEYLAELFEVLKKKIGLFPPRKIASHLGWAYLYLGGKDADGSAFKDAQGYLGVAKTGVLDEKTKAAIEKNSGKPFWKPVLVSWGLAPERVGMARAIQPVHRVTFLNKYWPQIRAYGPLEHIMTESKREAFDAAVKAYQREIFGMQTSPKEAASNAYRYTYQSYGLPKLAREDDDVLAFFENVLARLDDMILYEMRGDRGQTERMRLIGWGGKGVPPGAEKGGFLRSP